MRQALAVASEMVPWVKTGGLADVVGALPGAMAAQGWDLHTLIPGYPGVIAALGRAKAVLTLGDLCGGPARVLAQDRLLVLDAPHLYARPGTPYLDAQGRDWPDNDLRLAALCQLGARLAQGALKGFAPEVVHLHDWQAGLLPEYLRDGPPCVLTIHNIAFHGLTGPDRLGALGLDALRFTMEGFEYYGHISALKAGITGARRVTTVSPTYARELLTPDFGMGLEGVLRARGAAVQGILNGIDEAAWNPATDPAITPYSTPAGKAANARALRAEFGLPRSKGPLAIVVSRLSDQKGLDLLLDALPAWLDAGGQIALLGSGDRRLENAWLAAAGHPGVAVRIGYDEALSHRMFAGGDAVLVPSRFEPCGLTQMYGLRYGAVPVVARTGGLADTVIHANAAALGAGTATGIVHDAGTVTALAHALRDLAALHAQPQVFRMMQRNGMRAALGWDSSAAAYGALYDEVTRG
jgi:starch synthase